MGEVLVTQAVTSGAWDEHSAIEQIRMGVEYWEKGDEDATRLRPQIGETIVLSSDQINARQAFPYESVRSLTRRGMLEAASDIAATGAAFLGVQIDVRAPDLFVDDDFRALGLGIRDALGVLGGGELLQASNLSRGEFGISFTVVGISDCEPLSRRGALPGDQVYASGPLGGWDAALMILNSGQADEVASENWEIVCRRFLDYRPEMDFGRHLLSQRLATACIDANDRVTKTLEDLARASQVGIIIDSDRLPVDPLCHLAHRMTGRPALETVLNGVSGDDRLIFTAPPEHDERVRELFSRLGRPTHAIGEVARSDDPGVTYLGEIGDSISRYMRPVEIYSEKFGSSRDLVCSEFPHGGCRFGTSAAEEDR
ncbi:AIR synthase-related protein [Kribbella sp. CA-253562]|uniref:AIR synthase-related protein n=1 Tax=Kribbella sp. CA-253562 TaxID=3239942 RepID=UPI003D941FFF